MRGLSLFLSHTHTHAQIFCPLKICEILSNLISPFYGPAMRIEFENKLPTILPLPISSPIPQLQLIHCEFSFNKHKQIDTRHNNANNVCVRPSRLHNICI